MSRAQITLDFEVKGLLSDEQLDEIAARSSGQIKWPRSPTEVEVQLLRKLFDDRLALLGHIYALRDRETRYDK
jgi:hypothetical protein